MIPRALLDTGPLVAVLNQRDAFHAWARTQFARVASPLLTCEAVIAEASHLLRGHRHGERIVLDVLERGVVQVEFTLQDEVASLRQLRTRYANVPMDLADACLVRMAEIRPECPVLTLDSDFSIYRRHGNRPLEVIIPR